MWQELNFCFSLFSNSSFFLFAEIARCSFELCSTDFYSKGFKAKSSTSTFVVSQVLKCTKQEELGQNAAILVKVYQKNTVTPLEEEGGKITYRLINSTHRTNGTYMYKIKYKKNKHTRLKFQEKNTLFKGLKVLKFRSAHRKPGEDKLRSCQ